LWAAGGAGFLVVFFFAGFLVGVAGVVLDAAFGAGVGFGVAAGFACGAARMPVAKSAVSDSMASNFLIRLSFSGNGLITPQMACSCR
jgi:SNF family Na+-dependent transporter